LPNRFNDNYPLLAKALQNGDHELPPGVDLSQITQAESILKSQFPSDFKEFLFSTDGAELWDGAIRFWPISKLPTRNQEIRKGWFDEKALFFAESDWPDFYFFDLSRKQRNHFPVKYFVGEPCTIAEAALDFTSWLKLLCDQQGHGVPREL
jgi:SMI1/KNR4 family protein SUKH-1